MYGFGRRRLVEAVVRRSGWRRTASSTTRARTGAAPARRARSRTSWVPPTLTSNRSRTAPRVDQAGGVEHGAPRRRRRRAGRARRGRGRRRRRPRRCGRPARAAAASAASWTRHRTRARSPGEGADEVLPEPPGGAGDDDVVGRGRVAREGGDGGVHRSSARSASALRAAIVMIAACGFTPGASGSSEASLTRRFARAVHPAEAVGARGRRVGPHPDATT